MSKLSALVVAHNEQDILQDCLDRLRFADEIEGERRMAGIEACAGPWVLEVDADEWIEAPLADEIASAVRADDADFHFMPMQNHVGNRWVRFGWMAALVPDFKGSLFRKGHKSWGMDRVHPQVSFSGRSGAELKYGIRHNFVRDITGLVHRFNRNTSLRAEDLQARDEMGQTPTMARKALSRFFKCYVSRKGYREGGVGLVISALSALYPLVAHLKAQEPRQRPPGT